VLFSLCFKYFSTVDDSKSSALHNIHALPLSYYRDTSDMPKKDVTKSPFLVSYCQTISTNSFKIEIKNNIKRRKCIIFIAGNDLSLKLKFSFQ
jgi:hypothetical protein